MPVAFAFILHIINTVVRRRLLFLVIVVKCKRIQCARTMCAFLNFYPFSREWHSAIIVQFSEMTNEWWMQLMLVDAAAKWPHWLQRTCSKWIRPDYVCRNDGGLSIYSYKTPLRLFDPNSRRTWTHRLFSRSVYWFFKFSLKSRRISAECCRNLQRSKGPRGDQYEYFNDIADD